MTFACLFLLLVINITQEIPRIHGRPLNSDIEKTLNATPLVTAANINNPDVRVHDQIGADATPDSVPALPSSDDALIGESQASPPPLEHDIGAFRPTTPGHSPGVGHGFHN